MPSLKLETEVDSSKSNSGLESFKEKVRQVGEEGSKELGSFGQSFTKLGPLIGTAIAAIAVFKEAIGAAFERAEEFHSLSEKYDIDTQKIQTLANAAKFYGVSAETLGGSLNKLLLSEQAAFAGSQEQQDAFKDLGITMDEVKDKSLDEVFFTIADAVARSTDKSKAYADVIKLMGTHMAQVAGC